ncbi:MAG: SCP2 sterol-binding domain-containing protein [Candidatus Lokiarchaeota archaeon]|nr:SCP2 sterol-binding domain-containing protein [Candidatus Lokiarchaeota archaeon]
MADIEALKAKLLPKFKAQEFGFDELGDALQLMCELGNTEEDFQDEYEDFTKTYQFAVSDKPESDWMWLKVEKGKFSCGKGKIDQKDLTFTMTAQLAADMISGKVNSNSAFLSGQLKLEGSVKDGAKFQGMQAIMRDVLGLD